MDFDYEIAGPQHAAVLAHYRAVMPRLVRHFGETPVVWVTYQHELGIDPVYHKDVDRVEHFPATIGTVWVRTSTGRHKYVALSEHNLTWLVAGRFAVEIHGWTPLATDLSRASYGRIILSPHGAAGDPDVVAAARLLRHALAEEGLQAIPVLDGFRGLTLWIPFDDSPSYDRLAPWLHDFAARTAARHAKSLTTANLFAERGDRVYLGTKSNHPGMGSLLPYALRGTPSLEVSVPVSWDDLDRVQNGDVTAANYADYDARSGDALEAMREAISSQLLPYSASVAPAKMLFVVESPEVAPRGYIIAAALQVLADGKPHGAKDILEQSLKQHLMPRSTTEKYVYTALREYVLRNLGAGRKPEFIQIEGQGTFRLNREPDTWPDVELPPRPMWLSAGEIEAAEQKLHATATGGEPAAFELAVNDAFGLLGFVARHLGGNAQPDVVVDAPLGVRGYRAIVECKTASPGGIVNNPRADEPARFRDAEGAQYAVLVGPAFGNIAALDDELRHHGVSLWTVDDLATWLRAQFGPADLEPLMAGGRVADRLRDAVWADEHGERKHVAVVAHLLHVALWQAQRSLAASVPVSEAPVFTEDAALLMVDEALAAAAVSGGASRAIVRQAMQGLEARGVLQRSDAQGMIVVVPPPAR
jgi:bifunctional non-homologous end joining protein LigD